MAIIFDVCEEEFWHPILEDIFEYNLGDLAAVVAVIWTFITALILYILEKAEVRQYGIDMRDIIFASMSTGEAGMLLCLFFGEIFFLILGIIGEWHITVVTIAISLSVIMVYVFFEICRMSSRKYVLYQLKQEFVANICGDGEQKLKLMEQMIRCLDYQQNDSLDELLKVLCEVVSVQSQVYTGDIKRIHNVCCQITESILKVGKASADTYLLIQNWFYDKRTPFEVRQGIMMAFFNGLNPKAYREVQKMLEICQDDSIKLMIWIIVYSIKLQKKVDEDWRSHFIRCMVDKIDFTREEYIQAALTYWEQLKDDGEDGRVLFEYILELSDGEK